MLTFFLIRKWLFIFTSVGVVLSGIAFWRKRRIPLLLKCWLLVAGLGMALLLDMYVIEPNWIRVKRVTISNADLADVLREVTVVQLTDLHVPERLGFRERSLIRKVNGLDADVIIITGDFLDEISELPATVELLRSLKAKVGIYGVPGNTDYHRFKIEGLAKELAAAGVTMLRNEVAIIALPNGKSLHLAGLDDPVTKRARMKETLAKLPSAVPAILLSHSPEIYGEAVGAGVSLVLSGHTHGGQIGIPFLVEQTSYADRTRFLRGVFHDGKTSMYVNPGIGTKKLPVRFLCRPEVTVFEFH